MRRGLLMAGMAAALAGGSSVAQEYRTTPDSAAAPAEAMPPPPPRTVSALRSDPEEVRAGIEMFTSRRYEEAVRILEAAVIERPDLPRVWQALGLSHWAIGDTARAAETWRRSLALDPLQPHVHEWLGDLLSAGGDVRGALHAYDEALRLQPTNLDVLVRRSRIARWAGLLEDAIERARGPSEKNPRRLDLRQELAAALFADRRYAEAAPLWQEIRRQRPDDRTARIRDIACRTYTTGDPAVRLEAEAFLLQNPTNLDALRLLADLAESGSDPMGAIVCLRQMAPLIQDPKKRARVVLRIVGILESQSETDPERFPSADAIAMLDGHLASSPEEVDVLLQLGELCLVNGAFDRAAGIFRSVLDRFNPQNIRAERGLFELALQRQDAAEGRRRFERIAAFNPSDPYLHVLRSRLAAVESDHAAALGELERLERAGLSGTVAVLLYHGITETDRCDIPSSALIREQLLALRDAGYRFIAAHEIPDYLASHGVPAAADNLAVHAPERVACVTFDDARRDAMRLGTPLSRELDIPFTMHVPVDYVNADHPFMAGWESLRQCASDGRWHYGSHALDGHEPRPQHPTGIAVHPLANRVWRDDRNRRETPEEYLERLDAEYRASGEAMRAKLPHPEEQTCFAYPFGDIGQLSHCNVSNAPRINLEIAARHYRTGFIQSQYGHAVHGDNPLLYQRTEPRRGERGADLVARILRAHPVFVARARRVELAALADKPYLARETLALLERDGYPAPEIARLRERTDRVSARPLFKLRFWRSAPAVRPAPAAPAAGPPSPARPPPGPSDSNAPPAVARDTPPDARGREPADREELRQELRDSAGGLR